MILISVMLRTSRYHRVSFFRRIYLEKIGWQGTVSNLFDGINVLNDPEAFTSAQSYNFGGVILQADTSVRFQF